MTSHARIKIATGFWESLYQLGIDANHVVRKARLPLTIITAPFVITTQYFAIWKAYSDIIDDTTEGIIKLATAFDAAHYPQTVLATENKSPKREFIFS